VIARYRDLRIGLADASLVVLAARYGAVASCRSTNAPSERSPRWMAAPSRSCPPTD